MLSFVCLSLCFTSCSGSKSNQAGDSVALTDDVYVTNYPTLYLAERIGGDHCNFVFPFPADADPAYATPDTTVVRDMQRARLILMNGADYEKWVNQVSLPGSRLVDTSASFKDNYIYILDGPAHRHGPDGPAHRHAGIAPATWLDPTLAVEQANAICEALSESWPEHASKFQESLEDLKKEFDSIEQAFSDASPGDRPLLAFHPVYEYPAKRYRWNLESVHWEPRVEPNDEEWQAFDELLSEHPASLMLWEEEPLESTREALDKREIKVVVFRTCSNRPTDSTDDYLSVMRANIENFKAALASFD